MFSITHDSISYSDDSALYSAKMSDLGIIGIYVLPNINTDKLVLKKKDEDRAHISIGSLDNAFGFTIPRIFNTETELVRQNEEIVKCKQEIRELSARIAKFDNIVIYKSCYLLPKNIDNIHIMHENSGLTIKHDISNKIELSLSTIDNELIDLLPNLKSLHIYGICNIVLEPIDRNINLYVYQTNYCDINEYITLINELSQIFCRIETLIIIHKRMSNNEKFEELPVNILNIVSLVDDIRTIIREE